MSGFVELIAELHRTIERLKLENMCDVCAGTGATLHGGPCMCGGTGKMSDAARNLREDLIKARNPYTEEGLCPTCHSPDNMRAHDKPCFYCGEKINNLAGNPGKWSLHFPQPDGTGICQHYHTECVMDRLRRFEIITGTRGGFEAQEKIRNCTHKFIPSNPRTQKDDQYSGVVCEYCDIDVQGWYCPDSPDHLCDYDLDNDPCRDYCLFCGEPEERK